MQIPPDQDGYITLENGIEVKFSQGDYATGDYWLIPTRPGMEDKTGGIEWPSDDKTPPQPIAQPPRAIQNRDGHHYAPLALLELQSDQKFKFKENCRTFFHPLAAKDLDQMAKDLKQMQAQLDRMQFKPFQDIEEPWCPKMVVLPPGGFLMGSPPNDKDADPSEQPQHYVRIRDYFAIGCYPVTFEEYNYFCEKTPQAQKLTPPEGWETSLPVVDVSWWEAKVYCDWLSKMTGQRYRLPTEAEWEYACRAGTSTRYAFGDQITDKYANYGSKIRKPTVLGTYQPNPWGLYDMHGNVWEWVQDPWHKNGYNDKPRVDGSSWDEGGTGAGVLRGGTYFSSDAGVRSAQRLPGDWLGLKYYTLGFRVVRLFPFNL